MEPDPLNPNNPTPIPGSTNDPLHGEIPQQPAGPTPVAFCRACGRGLTRDEVRPHGDTVYCEDHVPGASHSTASRSSESTSATPQSPYSQAASTPLPATGHSSPGLAFLLGLIPGVGAIYNGQFAKAVVHLLITTLICSLAGRESGSMEPLFDMLVPVWIFYMALEAYHTAKKKQAGEPVDEFSSIFPSYGARTGFPLLPVLLIGLGVLFLLDNLHLLRIRQLIPYAGPLFLIALGGYMLYVRLKANAAREVFHERN